MDFFKFLKYWDRIFLFFWQNVPGLFTNNHVSELCCVNSLFLKKTSYKYLRTEEITRLVFPSLLDIEFQLINSSGPPVSYFLVHHDPNVFSGWQVWTAVYHLDSLTTESCCWNTCTVCGLDSVLLMNNEGFPWKKQKLSGWQHYVSVVSKACKYCSA